MKPLSVRDLRIEKNVMGTELAQKLNINPTTLSRYERGRRAWPAHLEQRAYELLNAGKCRTKTTPIQKHFALVHDSSVQAFLVFHVFARDKEEVEERIRRFYEAQGWDYKTVGDIHGFTIKTHTPLYLGQIAYPVSPIIRLPRTRVAARKEG